MTRCQSTAPHSRCLSTEHRICISYIFRPTMTSLTVVTLHSSHRQHQASKLNLLVRPDFPSQSSSEALRAPTHVAEMRVVGAISTSQKACDETANTYIVRVVKPLCIVCSSQSRKHRVEVLTFNHIDITSKKQTVRYSCRPAQSASPYTHVRVKYTYRLVASRHNESQHPSGPQQQ
jgi:hypothetical protein